MPSARKTTASEATTHKTTPKTTEDAPVVEFASQAAWEKWLAKNHLQPDGVWLCLAKKTSGVQTMTYAEALESALCYGWIDGQKRSHNAQAWLQKFTPRRKKSIWSKINRQKALALIESGRMRAPGIKEIELAKADGRWEQAYDSPKAAAVPPDLEAALKKNAKARAFFATLDSANRYAVLWRIQTAKKADTRSQRIQRFVGMLAKKQKLHP